MSKNSSMKTTKNNLMKKDYYSESEKELLQQAFKLFEEGKAFNPLCEGEQVSFEKDNFSNSHLVCKYYDQDYNAKKSYIALAEVEDLIEFLQNFVKSCK